MDCATDACRHVGPAYAGAHRCSGQGPWWVVLDGVFEAACGVAGRFHVHRVLCSDV